MNALDPMVEMAHGLMATRELAAEALRHGRKRIQQHPDYPRLPPKTRNASARVYAAMMVRYGR